MKRLFFVFVIVSTIGASGCATMGNSVYANDDGMTAHEREMVIEIRQEKSEQRLKDVYGGYKLISESSDLYLEKVDGSEKTRITNTPDIKETWAIITKNGSCIAYRTIDSTFLKEEIYLQPIGKDSSFSEKLSDDQWDNLLIERFPGMAQDNY